MVTGHGKDWLSIREGANWLVPACRGEAFEWRDFLLASGNRPSGGKAGGNCVLDEATLGECHYMHTRSQENWLMVSFRRARKLERCPHTSVWALQ